MANESLQKLLSQADRLPDMMPMNWSVESGILLGVWLKGQILIAVCGMPDIGLRSAEF